MHRVLAPVLLGLCCLAHAGDLKSTLDARYKELNKALLKGDVKAAEHWVEKYCTADFGYTSRDKHRYSRDKFAVGLGQQIRATKKVLDSTVKIGTPKLVKGQAVVTTSTNFKGIVSFDGRDLALTDKSQTRDVWVRVGSDWKLRASVQTSSDTQMFER